MAQKATFKTTQTHVLSTQDSVNNSHRNSLTQARSITPSFTSQNRSQPLQRSHLSSVLTPKVIENLRGAVPAQKQGVKALKDIAKWHAQVQMRTSAGQKKAVLETSGERKTDNKTQLRLKDMTEGTVSLLLNARTAKIHTKSQINLGKSADYKDPGPIPYARSPNHEAQMRVFGSQIDTLPGTILRKREEAPLISSMKKVSSFSKELYGSFEFKDNGCVPSSLSLLQTSPRDRSLTSFKKSMSAVQRVHYHSPTPLY